MPNVSKYRKIVDRKKSKFEKSFKKSFRKWQIEVHKNFIEQIKITNHPKVSKEHEDELELLIRNHYKNVAEGFVLGLEISEVKQSEVETNYTDFLIPAVLLNINNFIQDQIELQLPIHSNSIIETTNKIGSESNIITQQDPDASYSRVLANKMSAREITVSVTETNWIANASMETAIFVTTPVLQSANKDQLKELQKISPNVTLKEENIDKLFETESIFLINAFRDKISNPKKEWIDIGDNRVRPSHRAISGTVVDENEPFILPGGKLMYPADSSLGVDFREVVNCRCFVLYI